MVKYPINYEKPGLIEYIVEQILESNNIDTWERLDLGEIIAADIDSTSIEFDMKDDEYKALCEVLDRWLKEKYGDTIQERIKERIEEGEESLRDYRENLEEITRKED